MLVNYCFSLFFFQLVLYILSHMSRCPLTNDSQQNSIPEAPPSYDTSCPSYLPPEVYSRTNDINQSSWSLSGEFLKNMTLADISNIRRNILAAELLPSTASQTARTRYQSLSIDANNDSVLPY